MKVKEMLEHYKLNGERVDEVLYQNDRQDGSLCESCCKK